MQNSCRKASLETKNNESCVKKNTFHGHWHPIFVFHYFHSQHHPINHILHKN